MGRRKQKCEEAGRAAENPKTPPCSPPPATKPRGRRPKVQGEASKERERTHSRPTRKSPRKQDQPQKMVPRKNSGKGAKNTAQVTVTVSQTDSASSDNEYHPIRSGQSQTQRLVM